MLFGSGMVIPLNMPVLVYVVICAVGRLISAVSAGVIYDVNYYEHAVTEHATVTRV